MLANALQPGLQAIHVDVNDWRGEESKHLADDEAPDDGDAKRTAEFRANAIAESERQSTEERSHGSHENWTKAKQACFVNGL